MLPGTPLPLRTFRSSAHPHPSTGSRALLCRGPSGPQHSPSSRLEPLVRRGSWLTTRHILSGPVSDSAFRFCCHPVPLRLLAQEMARSVHHQGLARRMMGFQVRRPPLASGPAPLLAACRRNSSSCSSSRLTRIIAHPGRARCSPYFLLTTCAVPRHCAPAGANPARQLFRSSR